MKKAPEVSILRNDSGTPYGFVLGGDVWAEHESGIKEIRGLLGVGEPRKRFLGFSVRPASPGVERRMVTRYPVSGVWCDRDDVETYLIVGPSAYDQDRSQSILRFSGDEPIVGAWDSKEFAVLARGAESRDAVLNVHHALCELDAVVMLTGGSVFASPGLLVARASMLPQGLCDSLRSTDENRDALTEAATACGVREKLSAAGCEFFALDPRWSRDIHGMESRTSHPVCFWLNPREQRRNEAGYFSVEELLAWAQGGGPVVRTTPRGW